MKKKYTKRHGVIVVSVAMLMAFMLTPDLSAQKERGGRGKTATVSKEKKQVSRSAAKKQQSAKRKTVERKSSTAVRRSQSGNRGTAVRKKETTRTVKRNGSGRSGTRETSRTTVKRKNNVGSLGSVKKRRSTGPSDSGTRRGDGRRNGDDGVRSGDRGSRDGNRTITRDGRRVNRGDGGGLRSGRGSAYDLRSKRKIVRRHRPTYKPKKYHYRHRSEYDWCDVRHRPGHFHYHNSRVHVSSHLYLGLTWPWVTRRHRHWSPRYRYRQVVYVNVGWGRKYNRRARVDVRTYYRHRVRHATDYYAEIDIEVDEIEIFRNGRFYGRVDRIPSKLRKIRATVYNDGRVEFDRDVFLLGDTESGFEMISTRYYDDYVLNSYRDSHGLRVGELDLYDERVRTRKRSRLFRYRDFNGFVPISLLPDDDRLFDYGFGSAYSDYYNDDEYGGYTRRDERSFSGPNGAEIRLERESQVERLDSID